MIESLFGYAHADKDKNGPKKDSMFQDASKQYVQIIDQKKAQNLAILLKALNVTTEEVCDALKEGDLLFPSIYQDKETLKLIVFITLLFLPPHPHPKKRSSCTCGCYYCD